MNKILYYLFVILLLFSHIDTYGKHSVICDVTYEESIGEWSDYHQNPHPSSLPARRAMRKHARMFHIRAAAGSALAQPRF